ncbi:MAG TPA: long-chain-fatty-acid--CoA ligase [Baekduia sp.]|jgi:long-chain acyl-CoA synthetase
MKLGDVTAFAARKFPDRVAVSFGDEVLTYRALDERSNRLANALAGGVIAPGDRVAVLMENRLEYLECYYGIPSAGAGLAHLNYRLHPRELIHIINDCGPSALIVEGVFSDTVDEILPHCPTLQHVIGIGAVAAADLDYEELLAGASPEPADHGVREEDLAWLLYTSGTTGQPKGAMLSHRNLLASAQNWMIDVVHDRGSVGYVAAPLFHVTGYCTIGYFLRGATILLRRVHDPEDFMRACEEHGVTGTIGIPTMIVDLLAHPRIDDYDLSSLREFLYGGSAIPAEILRRAMQRFPDATFSQGSGMTELGGNVLCLDAATHRRVIEEGRTDLLQATGRPMALTSARLVDDDMNDVPVGEVGELVLRADQVSYGYWNNPEATAEANAGGWFHTGDLFREDAEGYLSIVDRKKDMIISGGENVYSRQVEDVLHQHPDVAQAAVVGVTHPRWGEAVCAVIVAVPGTELTEAAIVEHTRGHLAGYKKPQRVVFVNALPRGASGKILKRELRATLEERRLFAPAAS